MITKTAKNVEGAEILPYTKANKLGIVSQRQTCDSHVTDKSQSTPHSNTVARVSVVASCSQNSIPKGDVKKVQAMGCITERNSKQRELQSL